MVYIWVNDPTKLGTPVEFRRLCENLPENIVSYSHLELQVGPADDCHTYSFPIAERYYNKAHGSTSLGLELPAEKASPLLFKRFANDPAWTRDE